MTKIEEIVNKYYDLRGKPLNEKYLDEGLSGIELEEIMKEYAEWYAKQHANNIADLTYIDDYGNEHCSSVDIFTLPLPPHE